MQKELKIAGTVEHLSIEDGSPVHNRLYPERLRIESENGGTGLNFLLRKWSHNDPQLKREWDAFLEINSPRGLKLIHTQRFMQEILAFVQHFLQLQDLLARVKTAVQDGRVESKYTYKLRISDKCASAISRSLHMLLTASACDFCSILTN